MRETHSLCLTNVEEEEEEGEKQQQQRLILFNVKQPRPVGSVLAAKHVALRNANFMSVLTLKC